MTTPRILARLVVFGLVGAAACAHSAPAPTPAAPTPPVTTQPVTPAVREEPPREPPPAPMPLTPVSFPPFREATLANGLRLIVVEKHDLPVVNVNLYVQSGDAADPTPEAGLAALTAETLTKGTTKRSAKEIAQLVEGAGGSLSAGSGTDWITVSAGALKEQLPLVLDLVSDVTLHPTFPQDEVETARKRMLSALQANLSQAAFVARRIFERTVYGPESPYGIGQTTKSLQALGRDDVQRFYRGHFRAGNALLVVSGDVSAADIEAQAKKYFGAWRGTGPEPIAIPAPPSVDSTRIYLVNRPGSVQSNILVGGVTTRPDDPDAYPLQVLNKVVGGGTDSRLFAILREEKGWTYGAYSELTTPRDVGYFVASAEVRTAVTDSSLAEMLHQLRRARDEVVPDSELAAAKSFLVGSFPLRIETAGQIASQVARNRLLGLSPEDLTQYREKIQAVTAADVQRVARKYVRPDHAVIVVVGDAPKVLATLKPIAPVTVLNLEGRPIDPASLEAHAATEKLDGSRLKPTTATYSLLVQGNALGTITNALSKEGDAWVGKTSTQSAMASQEAEVRFGPDLTPISSTQTTSQGATKFTSELHYANGKITGKAELPPQLGGTKSFDTAVPAGTLLPSMDDYAIAVLDLAPGKSVTLPTFDVRTGAAGNLTIKVVGEESVTVPAGTFDTYKLEVSGGAQPITLWARKELPHMMVKQEVAGAPVAIELKELR